jgi:hypothetical protein
MTTEGNPMEANDPLQATQSHGLYREQAFVLEPGQDPSTIFLTPPQLAKDYYSPFQTRIDTIDTNSLAQSADYDDNGMESASYLESPTLVLEDETSDSFAHGHTVGAGSSGEDLIQSGSAFTGSDYFSDVSRPQSPVSAPLIMEQHPPNLMLPRPGLKSRSQSVEPGVSQSNIIIPIDSLIIIYCPSQVQLVHPTLNKLRQHGKKTTHLAGIQSHWKQRSSRQSLASVTAPSRSYQWPNPRSPLVSLTRNFWCIKNFVGRVVVLTAVARKALHERLVYRQLTSASFIGTIKWFLKKKISLKWRTTGSENSSNSTATKHSLSELDKSGLLF